jgi:hypothetical protein
MGHNGAPKDTVGETVDIVDTVAHSEKREPVGTVDTVENNNDSGHSGTKTLWDTVGHSGTHGHS